MITIQFRTLIKADVKKVWNTMLDDKTYREWTKAFHPGSYYEGSWVKGGEIRFLAKSDEGKIEGMFSRIKENIQYRFVSIEHLGLISDGVVDTTSEQVQKWSSCFENYTFIDNGNQTALKIEVLSPDEYKLMFEEMWPKALAALKDLCEE